MSTGFFKNGNKAHHYINTLWKRRSISDSVGASITKPHFQQPNASNSRFSVRNLKEMELSVSFAGTNTKSFSSTGLVGWYLGLIKTRPILTKSITCALIYTVADLSSQTIAGGSSSKSYDFIRTLRMAGIGMIVLGPSLHYWFNFMSRLFPNRDLIATCKKIFMGHVIYGPIMTVVYFSVNAGLQGESGSEIVARLKRDLIPTLINCVMYWSVCDLIIFRFIPVHLQPLGHNSFSYIWTIYTTSMASLEKASTN